MALFLDDGTRLRRLSSRQRAETPTPVVVDSWLLIDGQARALEAHRARFTRSVAELGLAPCDAFWERAVALLPRTGSWFPRVEADEQGRFLLRVRPAPALGSQVRLWVAGPDPRRHPTVKGPDLPALLRLRDNAVAAGADEAILTRDGHVVEGATTCLLWWEGDTLCRPDSSLPTLPGITADLVLQEAGRRGIAIGERRARPDELDGREMWALNALHGLRPVTGWPGTRIRTGPIRRAADWQGWLTEQRRPLLHP